MNALHEIDGMVKSAFLGQFFQKKGPSPVPSGKPAPSRPPAPIQAPRPNPTTPRPQQGAANGDRNIEARSRAAASSAASDWAMAGAALDRSKEDFQQAYDFMSDIAPAIRMRQLGVDKLPENEARAFEDLKKVPVHWSNKLGKGIGGQHNSRVGAGELILLNDGTTEGSWRADPGILVHELRHALERRVPSKKKDTDFLDKIYRFLGVDIDPKKPGYSARWGGEEMYTTNKQHQFRIYQSLANHLKRKPTAAEYFEHVDSIPDLDLFNDYRRAPLNAYQLRADKVMKWLLFRIGDYRKAMKEVSRNEAGRGGWSQFAPAHEGAMT